MSFDLDTLYSLLPAIYRVQDLELGEDVFHKPFQNTGEGKAGVRLPLRALLEVIVEQVGVLEENLAQLYDDQFIETCAQWVIPYIGDLIGYSTPRRTPSLSQRSEVANTVSYRRRKGTTLLVEQLVQDITGWSVHIVEYALLLAATQHMDRLRPENRLVDLRNPEDLEWLGTPFESHAHTGDLRNLAIGQGGYNLANVGQTSYNLTIGQRGYSFPEVGQGHYNIPSIGVFLWRLTAYPLIDAPAARAFSGDDRRYLFNPLGNDTQLFSLPRREELLAQLSGVDAVAMPISRGQLERSLGDYYGQGKSLVLALISETGRREEILQRRITVSDLSDSKDSEGNPIEDAEDHATWNNMPEDHIAIDPVLGRMAFPKNENAPAAGHVHTTFHYGFSADMGGGVYHRATTFTQGLRTIEHVPERHNRTIQDALNALRRHRAYADGGVVEITDCGRYMEVPEIRATGRQCIELRAADFRCPLLALHAEKEGIPEMLVSGDAGAGVVLNGLVISNGPLRVSGNLGRLTLRHCTLVPGLSLSREGEPQHPLRPSLVVESPDTLVEIDHCIVGGLHVIDSAQVRITNSIVDATRKDGIAYAAREESDTHDTLPGGSLYIENSTITGRVHTMSLELASNTIFLAGSGESEEPPVNVEKRQEGMMRFSYVPRDSRTPRCYQCYTEPRVESEAEDTRDTEPQFTSRRYGQPGYCQLLMRNSTKILQGADDESEIGVFHDLLQPQREANLRERFKEYLRFTVEPGIIYMT
jgi:hypothetical protein